MDTMYSQYAEAQKIQLWCDGRSVLVYTAQWLPYKSINKAFFFNYEVLEVMSCDTPSSLLYFHGVWEITRDIYPLPPDYINREGYNNVTSQTSRYFETHKPSTLTYATLVTSTAEEGDGDPDVLSTAPLMILETLVAGMPAIF